MKQKLLYTLMFGTVIGLTACGGGGGGGSPGNPTPSYLAPPTSTVNATQVATINPLVGAAGFIYSTVNMYNEDLTGSGSQNVIVAGSNTSGKNNAISVFGWSNRQLVDQTSNWFAGSDNVVNPGAAKVSFGNFNGNGHQSMFVDPGSDGHSAPATSVSIFVNNGSRFTKFNVPLSQSLDSMDSATFTHNGVDNILALGYPYSQVITGSPTNDFRAYAVSNVSGSSVAAGNFLGTGAPSFVIGQAASSTGVGATPNVLYDFAQDPVTGAVTMNAVRALPVPLFNSTNAYYAATGGSNTLRVVKYDFDGSGADSVFITAMPNNWQTSPYQSSIQFLKNNGAGVFTDVTATTVTGYDMTKAASTNPVIIDLLNTGLADIVLPAPNSTQVLMQVSRGQYVASMANTITDFQNRVNSLAGANLDTQGGVVNFVKGPNNNLYLLDMVPLTINGTSQKGLYLTQLSGNTVAINAQSAITIARATWPWLTDAQLNTMIQATGQNYYGATILDDRALLSPQGFLTMGSRPISGYIAGVQFNGADSQLTAQDQLGRNFSVNLAPTHLNSWSNSFNMNSEHIDQHELTSHTEYLVNGAVNSFNGIRVGTETRNQFNTIGNDPSLGPTLGATPLNYTVGAPKMWAKSNWSGGVQYTSLNYNPWVAFGGSWGMIKQTGNLDTTIRYTENGFTAVAGSTYTTTQMTPGLIAKVNDIYGVWGETGYRWNDLGVYAGVKPIIVSGNVSANLPTGVDNTGNIVYTGKTLAIQNQTTGYIRALWTADINKKTMYRLSGTAMSNGQYRLMNELRFFFD